MDIRERIRAEQDALQRSATRHVAGDADIDVVSIELVDAGEDRGYDPYNNPGARRAPE